MPLPENNTPWPPKQYAEQLADMRIEDAWYSGDRKRLAKVYGTPDNRRDENGRPWRFWERPKPFGKRDGRLHVPLAEDIAATSAALLYSEPPTVTFEGTKTQERWEEIAGEGGLNNVLRESAEVASALGGVCLRATWNLDLADRPLITAVHADGALPDYSYGILTGVTMWREVQNDGAIVLRHLERHEPGKILQDRKSVV